MKGTAPLLPRPIPALVLASLLLAACAAPAPAPASDVAMSAVSASELPPIPICRDEMSAYVELTKLAKQHGDDWVVFEPAVEAMKQQILDCLDDNGVPLHAL
jgi:hypothetical protein